MLYHLYIGLVYHTMPDWIIDRSEPFETSHTLAMYPGLDMYHGPGQWCQQSFQNL